MRSSPTFKSSTSWLIFSLPLLAISAVGHADDSVVIWLASGAHGAPCGATGHCAANLDCDPETESCLRPGFLRVDVVDISGCRESAMLSVTLSNLGEIGVDELVQIPVSAQGTAWWGICNFNDPRPRCGVPPPPAPSSGPFFHQHTQSVSAYVQGGEVQQLSIPADLDFPAYVYSNGVRASAGTYSESPSYIDDIFTTAPNTVQICF